MKVEASLSWTSVFTNHERFPSEIDYLVADYVQENNIFPYSKQGFCIFAATLTAPSRLDARVCGGGGYNSTIALILPCKNTHKASCAQSQSHINTTCSESLAETSLSLVQVLSRRLLWATKGYKPSALHVCLPASIFFSKPSAIQGGWTRIHIHSRSLCARQLSNMPLTRMNQSSIPAMSESDTSILGPVIALTITVTAITVIAVTVRYYTVL